MSPALPIVLIPGLLASARLYHEQLPTLWRFGPVTVADHTRADNVPAIARSILATAPPRFALAGLSMGGYLAFEIVRQAPERVERLALLDTSARPDTPDVTERRRKQMALAQRGHLGEVVELQFEILLHPDRQHDESLRAVVRLMAHETGADAFVRQQTAIIGRPDSRPGLAAISCPTLVLVGDSDAWTPPEVAVEIADGIDGARLVVVPESGHLSTLERPEIVTRALVQWLTS
jgi:pimeloyl-ACP methyl ester carboxylesterase